MKRVITFLAVVGSLFGFSGCNSSDIQNTPEKESVETNIRMSLHREYIVQKGDEIEKLSDDAELKIVSDFDTNTTKVRLLSGEAAIIKK